jgi:transcriptional regulator with XRE-family HTH domain
MTVGEVIASRIRHFRKTRGFTQERLAEELQDLGLEGFSQSMVAKVETDHARAENLSVRRLLAFAMALNVAPVHLLTPDKGADRVQLDGREAVVYAGSLRTWIRGGWPLRDEDDRREFFAAIPEEEFNALLAQRERRAEGEGIPATEFYLPDAREEEQR